MSRTVYGVGGYRPAHPSQGRIAEHDDATATFTRWNDAGTVVESRPYTAGEAAIAAAEAAAVAVQANQRTVEDRARAAITANNTYLAIASPTNAQVVAQVRRLTQECTALIKLALNDLADANGT